MKLLSRIINASLYVIVSFLLLAAISSAIMKRPMFMTTIRSNSMYPTFERGDILFIEPTYPKDILKIGDIIVFKTKGDSFELNGWISHRIIGGDSKNGYITKGDANDRIDQDGISTTPIKLEWIAGRIISIGSHPIKLPLIGHLPLWMEKYQKNPFVLPAITLILSIIIGISELMGEKKKQKKNKLELPLIYFFSGLTVSIMLCASTLSISQHLTVTYEVSETSQGVLMGSNVGILSPGEVVERPLSELKNQSFLPIVSTITCSDPQVIFSHVKINLMPSQQVNTTMRVIASSPGKYQPTIHVGMFYPFLPSEIIYSLAKQSYWLALIILSLIPGLPIMLYPLIDSQLRRKAIKEIRRKFRRIINALPVSF